MYQRDTSKDGTTARPKLQVIFPLMKYPNLGRLAEPDMDNLQTIDQEPISELHALVKSSFTEYCGFLEGQDYLYVCRYVAPLTHVEFTNIIILFDALSDTVLSRENYCWQIAKYIPHTFVSTSTYNDVTALEYLMVNPRHQSNKIGQSIVASVEEIAQEFNSKKVRLDALHSSIGFWEKQGYTQDTDPNPRLGTVGMVKYRK